MVLRTLRVDCYHPFISAAIRALYFRPGYPVGKARRLGAVEKLLGSRRIQVKTRPGFLFACDQRDWLQRNLLCNRVHEVEVSDVLTRHLNRNDIFFDVGANAGYFSLLALSAGVRRVVAFEPDPLTCGTLRDQLRLNGWGDDHCAVIERGLSDAKDRLDLIRGSDSGESGFGDWPHRLPIGHISVEVTTLDDYCESEGVQPDVMKIDVEGWELNVLKGALKTLKNPQLRLITFEAEVDAQAQMVDPRIAEVLRSCGFVIDHIPRPSGALKATENFCAYR